MDTFTVIYWLVNNNYQVEDALHHLSSMRLYQHCLVRIPHTLDSKAGEGRFARVVTLSSLRLGSVRAMAPWGLHRAFRETHRLLAPGPEDVLLIYTEYELRNHMVVQRFRERGARVFIIEEGIATYFELCFPNFEHVSAFRRLIGDYLRLMGFRYTRPTSSDSLSKFVMRDDVFDGAFLYQQTMIERDVPIVRVDHECAPLRELREDAALFLNEDVYSFYQPFDEYCRDLRILLGQLTKSFREVYFKFHPRELKQTPEKTQLIRDLVREYDSVEIIESAKPIEALVGDYRVRYVVSYLSVGLMNLFFRGMQPFYVYTLFPKVARHKDFVLADRFLRRLGYHFLTDVTQIKPGYDCGMDWSATEGTIGDWLSSHPLTRLPLDVARRKERG